MLSIEQIKYIYDDCMSILYTSSYSPFDQINDSFNDIECGKLIYLSQVLYLTISGQSEPIVVYFIYDTTRKKFIKLLIKFSPLSKLYGEFNLTIDIDNF